MIGKEKPTGVGKSKGALSVPQLAKKAIEAGFRVTPVKKKAGGGILVKPFGNGQTYILNDFASADMVGVVMDNMVLVDYDGNKADEAGDYIISVDELAKKMGLAEMPPPVQVGSDGRSLHWLFKLPEGVVPGQNIKQSSNGEFEAHIDIKCGNQLMHLKPNKEFMGFPDESLELPQRVVTKLAQVRRVHKSDADLLKSLRSGENVHDSALEIVNRMKARGASDMDIWTFFFAHKDAIAESRGIQRAKDLFDGSELSDLIGSAYAPVVPFGVEEVETSIWDDWVYVAHEHKFYSRSKREAFKPEAFNALLANQDTYVGKRRYKPADFALQVQDIPRAAYAMYAPCFGEFFKYKGSECFNTYKEGFVPATAEAWPDIFQRHLELLFPNDWRVIAQWMAYVVRNAGRKVLWSPLLKGIEGDGKTAIGNMIIAALGQENAHQIDMDSIRSSFNAWAEGACFGIIEEVRVGGQDRRMIMDKLKPLITNTEISITRKGQNPFTALNTMNYLLLTNHEDALMLTDNDRRYGVFFTQFTDKSQLPSIAGHYEPLWDAIRTQPEAIRGWLYSIDLSDFDPNKAPDTTDAKRRMIVNSRSEATSLLAEALELGGLGVHEETFNPMAVNILIEEYKLGRTLNNRQLPKAAEELGYERWPKLRWNGKTHTAYVKKRSQLVKSSDDIKVFWEQKSSFDPE